MSWVPHPTLAECGTFPDVPPQFTALFTLRGRSYLDATHGRIEPDYRALAVELGLSADRLVRVRQVHGKQIRLASEAGQLGPHGVRLLDEADGLLTADPDTLLVGLSADCSLLLLADPATGACGMAHAGWRGAAQDIGGRLVARMREEFGSSPDALLAFIGPTIGPCCYEVGDEVFDALAESLPLADRVRAESDGDRDHLDLAEANRLLLCAAGLRKTHIIDSGLCTHCNPDLLFSYRRDGSGCGLFAGLIGRTRS